MSVLFIRVTFVYFFMILFMKLLGKRQVGQMQMSELVTAFFLSELATYTVTDVSIPLLFGVVPVVAMVCLELMVSFLILKSPWMKKTFDFSPSLLISEGVILEKELVKSRLTLDELFSLLRLAGYYDVSKVRFGILEPNGQLSVVPFPDEETVTCKDLAISGETGGYTVAVINDGKINRKALTTIQKTEKWMRGVLRKNKIQSEREVFLMSSDFNGKCSIVLKDKNRV